MFFVTYNIEKINERIRDSGGISTYITFEQATGFREQAIDYKHLLVSIEYQLQRGFERVEKEYTKSSYTRRGRVASEKHVPKKVCAAEALEI